VERWLRATRDKASLTAAPRGAIYKLLHPHDSDFSEDDSALDISGIPVGKFTRTQKRVGVARDHSKCAKSAFFGIRYCAVVQIGRNTDLDRPSIGLSLTYGL